MGSIDRMYKQMQRHKVVNPSFTRRCYNTLLDYIDDYIFDPIDNFKSFFRNIKIGITNLITYAPIIYNDRDWDHHYFFLLLDKKLNRMYKELSTQQHAHIHPNYLKSLKTCSILVKRIVEDDYIDDVAQKKLDELYGSYDFVKDNDIGFSVLTRSKELTEKEEKQYRREVRELSQRERNRKKQDIDMLFKLLNKHVEGYWW